MSELLGVTTMHEFDVLCLLPVEELAPWQIGFAEVGERSEEVWNPSMKTLELLKDKGLGILL